MKSASLLLIFLIFFSCKKEKATVAGEIPVDPPKREVYGILEMEKSQGFDYGGFPIKYARVAALFSDRPSDNWDTITVARSAGTVVCNELATYFYSDGSYSSSYWENVSLDTLTWKVSGSPVVPAISYSYVPVYTSFPADYKFQDTLSKKAGLTVNIQGISNGNFDRATLDIFVYPNNGTPQPPVKVATKGVVRGQTTFVLTKEDLDALVISNTNNRFLISFKFINELIVNVSGKDFLFQSSLIHTQKKFWVKP